MGSAEQTHLKKPDLVLRVAVVGSRNLELVENLEFGDRFKDVFVELERKLEQLAPRGRNCDLSRLYSDATPTLRLMTGLADGVDLLAAKTWRGMPLGTVDRQLIAVLAFEKTTFRDQSKVVKTDLFDELTQEPTVLIALDGHYVGDPGNASHGDEQLAAKRSREKAYRAQAAFLLRQCDLLIAAPDSGRTGEAGGTWETIERAFDLGIPVLRMPISGGLPQFLLSPTDIEAESENQDEGTWKKALTDFLERTLAGPFAVQNAPVSPEEAKARESNLRLLEEFFEESEPRVGLLSRLGLLFEQLFEMEFSTPVTWKTIWQQLETPLAKLLWARASSSPGKSHESSFTEFRSRASTLSVGYTGLYRGTYLVNFTLAVVAVALAATSLLLLELRALLHSSSHAWEFALFALGLLKLAILRFLLISTKAANGQHWIDKAVDFRYIAERLRGMLYLPHLGSLSTVAPGGSRYASRVLRQSVADWLFQALVRREMPTTPLKTPMPCPSEVIAFVKSHWLEGQAQYHRGNAKKMRQMDEALKVVSEGLGIAVVTIVAIDLVLALLALTPWFHQHFHVQTAFFSAWLIAAAAVLPAAVASSNGLRFQAECARLGDRSAQLEKVFTGLAAKAEALSLKFAAEQQKVPLPSLGATLEALRLADDCTRVTTAEVAEWSVLYAKEIPPAA